MPRSRLRRAFERWLSWYDPEAEARNHAATVAAIKAAERVVVRGGDMAVSRDDRLRAAYMAYADRLERR